MGCSMAASNIGSTNAGACRLGTNLLDKYTSPVASIPSGPGSPKPAYGTAKPHDAVFGFTMLDVGRPREIGVELSVNF